MAKKNQSSRLTKQHKESKGVVGIFGEEAKLHDLTVGEISHHVIKQLESEYPTLSFHFITKHKGTHRRVPLFFFDYFYTKYNNYIKLK